MKNGNGKAAPGRKHYGAGLYLQTGANGKSSWLYRYQLKGQAHWMGLGSKSKGVTLAKARQRAHDADDFLYKGIDPIAARSEQRALKALETSRQISFAEAAEQYYAKHEQSWTSPKHRRAFLSSLKTHAYPVLANMPVAAIDKAAVLKVIEPIWLVKNPTASNVLGRIESVLSWATSREYRTGANPAKWDTLKFELPHGGDIGKVVKHPAMPYSDLPRFVVQLSQRQGIGPKALLFIILTAARTSEVLKAVWSTNEFDLENKIWNVPAERMKGRKPHRVPLTGKMIELLKALPREAGNDLVFIGTKANAPLGKMVLPNLLTAMGCTVTVHGFRSSYRDWAAEQTSYPAELIEYSLAHTVGNAVAQAYQRSDMIEKRRQLMEAWSTFVSTPRQQIGVKEATPIRAKASV
jgi:integrase